MNSLNYSVDEHSRTLAMRMKLFRCLNSNVSISPSRSDAPYSVKAYRANRRPPRELEVAICDLKELASLTLSWNAKSSGKRFRLRRYCSFNRLVGAPYSAARSESRITRTPRIV